MFDDQDFVDELVEFGFVAFPLFTMGAGFGKVAVNEDPCADLVEQ